MPIEFKDPNTGAIIYVPTDEDKSNLDNQKKLNSLPQQFEELSNKLEMYIRNSAVNVKNLGAMGNNTGDTDTIAIQTALDISKTKGGVTVVIPDGVYRITRVLKVYKNTTIIMGANTKLLRCHNGAFFINGSAGDNFYNYEGNGNIHISGGVLDGNILEYTNGFNAVVLGRGSNITFTNVIFRDVSGAHAIDMNACEDVGIYGCKFLGFKPLEANSKKEAIQISNLTASSFGSDPDAFGYYDGTPCKNIRVSHCTFGSSPTKGTTSWATGVGQHAAVHDVYNREIYIENCYFDGLTYAGVSAMKFSETTISNCIFNNCAKGVYLHSAWGGTVFSNQDSNGVSTKLPQSGFGITVNNNVFKGTKGEHIFITGSVFGTLTAYYDDIKITNNRFINDTGSTNNMILLVFVSNAIISNNFGDNGGRFIELRYTKNVDLGINNSKNLAYEGVFSNEVDIAFNFPVEGEPGYDPTINSSTVATWYKNKGYSANLTMNGVKLTNVSLTGISLVGVWGFTITNVNLNSVATATSSDRDAIRITDSKNGEITNTTIIKNPNYVSGTGGANRYAVLATSTCSNIRIEPNNYECKHASKFYLVGATDVWVGNYMISPNGTRYRFTISDNGTPSYTVG